MKEFILEKGDSPDFYGMEEVSFVEKGYSGGDIVLSEESGASFATVPIVVPDKTGETPKNGSGKFGSKTIKRIYKGIGNKPYKVTAHHSDELEDVTPTSHWIREDGALMAKYRINNPKVKLDIESGHLKSASIGGRFKEKEINNDSLLFDAERLVNELLHG